MLCNRVAIIDYGHIKVLDSPENLKNSLEGDVIKIEVDKIGDLEKKIRDFDSVKKVLVTGNAINITVKDGEKLTPQLLDFVKSNGAKVNSISIRKPSLGDVFLHYTGREIREEAANTDKVMMKTFMRGRG
jgi:ABC-2 type transport system ATP-binding protein